jgi:hypothetical protein
MIIWEKQNYATMEPKKISGCQGLGKEEGRSNE